MNLRAPSFKAGLAFVTSKGSCIIPLLMAGLTQTATALVRVADLPSIDCGQTAQVLKSVPVCDEMNVGVSVQPTIICVFANYCKFQTEYRLYM